MFDIPKKNEYTLGSAFFKKKLLFTLVLALVFIVHASATTYYYTSYPVTIYANVYNDLAINYYSHYLGYWTSAGTLWYRNSANNVNGVTLTNPAVHSVSTMYNCDTTGKHYVLKDTYINGEAPTSPPDTEFTGSITSDPAPLTVAFTDISTGTRTSWLWNFGDGGTSTSQNPSHTYTTAGTYDVSLTATNVVGSNTEVKTGYVVVTEGPKIPHTYYYTSYPVTIYGGSNEEATAMCAAAGYTNVYNDLAINYYSHYLGYWTSAGTLWYRNSANNVNGVTLTNPAVHSVSTMYNCDTTGKHYVLKDTYINGIAPPLTDFTSTLPTGTAPLEVQFTDTTTGSPTSWTWSFGDGTSSTEQNPSHIYAVAGTFDVSLTAANAGGSDTEEKVGYVIVTAPAQTEYKVYAEAAENENVYLMARGFWNELKGSNQDESVIWTDWQGSTDIIDYSSAYESHWTSNANQWVERGDFAYFSGHGTPNVFWFRNFTESADASRISLGSGRTKWAVIDSCLSLDYSSWENWNPSFNGLHMLLGWNTTTVPSFDSNAEGRGFVFAKLMKGSYLIPAVSQMKIIDAWEWAGKYTWGIEPTTSDHDIFNAAIYDTNCRDDYLPGWIPSGGNICTSLSGTRGYQSVLIFKKNRETGGLSTLMSSDENSYSVQASVPVTTNTADTYVPVRPGYTKEWASSLAKSLGMSGDIRETEDAFYAGDADAQEYYFEVRKDTSAISFQKFNGRSGLPQSESKSITAVDSFLRKNDLSPPNTPEPDVLNNVGESISSSGERHVDWKTNVITYPQMIDGLPVFNAQYTVEVDSNNTIIGLWRNWRNYQHFKEIPVKSPEMAFTEFKTRHDSDKKINAEKTRVTDVSLGYILKSSGDGEGTLQPVYIFEGNYLRRDLVEPFEPVVIDAKNEEVRENITSPTSSPATDFTDNATQGVTPNVTSSVTKTQNTISEDSPTTSLTSIPTSTPDVPIDNTTQDETPIVTSSVVETQKITVPRISSTIYPNPDKETNNTSNLTNYISDQTLSGFLADNSTVLVNNTTTNEAISGNKSIDTD